MATADIAPTMTVEVRQDGATSSKGIARTHEVLIDRPQDKGGADRGPMGGELLLLGLGGCFMSNLLAAIAARNALVTDVSVTVGATLAENPKRFSSYTLQVSARCDDLPGLEKLVTIAERGCISANTLKRGSEITVSIEYPN
jgi:putative redox protein